MARLPLNRLRAIFYKLRKVGKKVSPHRKYRMDELTILKKMFGKDRRLAGAKKEMLSKEAKMVADWKMKLLKSKLKRKAKIPTILGGAGLGAGIFYKRRKKKKG